MFSTRLLAFLLAGFILFGQAKKPLTFDDLIQLKKVGMDEQTIIDAVRANGSAADTSVQGLVALKNAGLSDRIISAVLTAGSSKPSAVAGTAPEQVGAEPDEIGVYFVKDGNFVGFQSEVVSTKTRGIPVPGATFKLEGIVSSVKSATQLMLPIEIVVRCPDDGSTATDYQLILLEPQKDHREFTRARGGTFRSTSTAIDGIPMKFEKSARNTYRAKLTDLKRGEYGILAPSGKFYTFGIID